MSDNRTPTVYNDNIFRSVVRQVKLAWRLFLDPRVNWMTKSLPIMAGIYLVSPIDFIMGIPGLSAMDDLAVAALGLKMFIEFSPPEVVQEHLAQLEGRPSSWDVVNNSEAGLEGKKAQAEDNVVEGEYSVVDEERP